jgi:hypothetical protein
MAADGIDRPAAESRVRAAARGAAAVTDGGSTDKTNSVEGGHVRIRKEFRSRSLRPSFAPTAVATLLLFLFGATPPASGSWFERKPKPASEGASAQVVESLRVRLRRFANIFAVDFTESTRRFSELAGTPEARIQGLVWRIEITNRLWNAANDPQPFEGLVDVLAVLGARRLTAEQLWLPTWGEPARPVMESLSRQENAAWTLAAQFTTPERLGQLRAIVGDWVTESAAERAIDAAAFPTGTEIVISQGVGPDSNWLLGLIGMDPLSGMDPAIAQIEQSRMLAERALYELEHLPELVSARLELLSLRTAASPEIQAALGDWARVSESASKVATRVDAWPVDLAAEREAAVRQLSGELTAQREGLVRDLETAREPLTELLRETRSTATAGRELSQAANQALVSGKEASQAAEATIRALDAMTARMAESRDLRAGSRPFNALEMKALADSATSSARAITETLRALEEGLPRLEALADSAVRRLDHPIDHAFARALQLLVAALVGAAATSLAVRWIRVRWIDPPYRGAGS